MTDSNDCTGCEALWYSATVPCGCMLRFKNHKSDDRYYSDESCPKPATDKEYKKLYNQLDRTQPHSTRIFKE